MITSIQHFCENGVKRLKNTFETYTEDLSKIAEMVYGVTDEVTKLGCSIIAEEWESYDELLRKRKDLRRGWYIVRKDETSLLTSLGEVVYHKTLFKNVATGESCYLLDQLMGLEHHARITEDAEARILQEASESSYGKGGASASINGESISKEAVMNKLHRLEFPALKAAEKKELKTLYIDADEDHVALQYLEHKGDIRKPRTNTVMPRIIYVYEGADTDKEGRPKLINPRYFGGVYDGPEAVGRLWTEVLDYLNEAYELDVVERIYINGDGASWIRTGEKIIPKSKFALDKYHMHKYLIAATSHLEGSVEDARNELYRAVHSRKKWLAEEVFDRIMAVTEKETKRKAVEQAAGAEEIIYSATEMIRMEKENRRKLGVLADLPVYEIPYPQIRKVAAIKNHIWGL